MIFLGMTLSVYAQQQGSASVEIETRSLDELYQAALEEGGEFVLRAGGDKSDQIDYYLDMFKARFPKLKVTHTVDVSIKHAPRYDNARAAGGKSKIPDVIQFQTLHRFTYYTEQGFLDIYKPKNWDKVFPDYKDPHGHWTGLYGVTFSNYVNTDLIPEEKAPRDAIDYLDPALKGKVILTYPHDDDALCSNQQRVVCSELYHLLGIRTYGRFANEVYVPGKGLFSHLVSGSRYSHTGKTQGGS